MNYLAHLFLAQPTPDSHFGNLLGDFQRGTDLSAYSDQVIAGLHNHRRVDRFTDQHDLIKHAKKKFSSQYRRFAGIALDVLFDHYLIKHWHTYSNINFDAFCRQAYYLLEQRLEHMPPRMQRVIGHMVTEQWLAEYQHVEGVAFALDRIAGRIRFSNNFGNSIEDIESNYQHFEQCFTQFFPELIAHIRQD